MIAIAINSPESAAEKIASREHWPMNHSRQQVGPNNIFMSPGLAWSLGLPKASTCSVELSVGLRWSPTELSTLSDGSRSKGEPGLEVLVQISNLAVAIGTTLLGRPVAETDFRIAVIERLSNDLIYLFFLTSYIIIIVNLQLYQEFLIIYHLNLTINGDLSRTAIASLTMVTHHTHWQTQIQFGPRAESCCRGSRGMIGTHGTVSASNRHFALSSAWSLFFLDLPVLRSLDTEAEGCWNKLKHRIYLQEDIAVLALPDPWLDLTSHFAGRGLQRSVLVFPQFVPIGRGKTGGVHGAYGGSESSIAAMQCNGLRRVTHLQQISDGSGDRIVDWPGWAISHQRSEDREHSHICRLGNWMRLNGIASYLPH